MCFLPVDQNEMFSLQRCLPPFDADIYFTQHLSNPSSPSAISKFGKAHVGFDLIPIFRPFIGRSQPTKAHQQLGSVRLQHLTQAKIIMAKRKFTVVDCPTINPNSLTLLQELSSLTLSIEGSKAELVQRLQNHRPNLWRRLEELPWAPFSVE